VYVCVCMRVRMCMRVRTCMRVCVCVFNEISRVRLRLEGKGLGFFRRS